MSDNRVFVDTNILTYLFDQAEPEKRSAAKRCLKAEGNEAEIVVSTQVLQELYVSLTKGKYPIASSEIAERAVRYASQYTTVQVDTQLVLSAITASQQHHISFWDALIIRAAAQVGCQRVLSEDLNDGQLIEGLRIENPLA